MIIRSLFRRYEKWNPVHPTYGAFWGIGVGIGCGVGWGPGFGPEVIGYVGSGCGVGFSVGITLLGLGIGLPANHLLEVPQNAFMVTRGALGAAGAGGLLGKGGRAGDGWGGISSRFSEMLQTPYVSFSSFKMESWTNIMDLPSMKSTLVTNVKHIADGLQRGKGRIGPWDRGMDKGFTIRTKDLRSVQGLDNTVEQRPSKWRSLTLFNEGMNAAGNEFVQQAIYVPTDKERERV